jgi:hypothetical protein
MSLGKIITGTIGAVFLALAGHFWGLEIAVAIVGGWVLQQGVE